MKFFDIKNLNYIYTKEIVLNNINLSYDNKDFLAIIGPNGGGKSTLLKLILGLLKSDNIKYFDLLLKQIGYVPQNTQANQNFSLYVLEAVLMGRVNSKRFGFYNKNDKKKAFEILKNLNIANLWDKQLTKLSGGQRQKVFIARALMDECRLLILDEPTASIDTKSAITIFDMLKSLHQQGIGIIIACHNINMALAYADMIAYVDKELVLHKNTKTKQKIDLIKHLDNMHSHFCDVEISQDNCNHCDNKQICDFNIKI